MPVKKVVLCWLLFALVAIASCKKETKVVPNNNAPDDPTVSNLLKENYVQKAYLGLIGRAPTDSEATNAFAVLSQNNCSVNDRTQLLNLLFASPEYNSRLYAIENANLLGSITTQSLQDEIDYVQDQLNDPQYANDYPELNRELDQLKKIKNITTDLAAGTITMVDVHRRCVDNPVYDDLTGGWEGMVSDMFNYFLFREPTENEMDNCMDMFDNHAASLFLQTGSSKAEYLNIFFSSDSYFEGQIRTLFKRYLYRDPSAEESLSLSADYKSNFDYKALQMKILLIDEFLGIE